MMTNTETAEQTWTHAAMMACRDGGTYLWVNGDKSFAKLVRDGRTIARIDQLTDGTVRATINGERTEGMTWETASAWLTSHAVAAALTA